MNERFGLVGRGEGGGRGFVKCPEVEESFVKLRDARKVFQGAKGIY